MPLTSQGPPQPGAPGDSQLAAFPASSGDGAPTTDLLCDLVQVTPPSMPSFPYLSNHGVDQLESGIPARCGTG